MTSYDIVPMGKPRMTKRDSWKKRPVILAYWAFRDHVKLLGISVPDYGSHIKFILPMPGSWSKKKKLEMNGTPHQQTPDVDNLLKALLDATHAEDKVIWNTQITKIWGFTGKIIIEDAMTDNKSRKNIQRAILVDKIANYDNAEIMLENAKLIEGGIPAFFQKLIDSAKQLK